MGAAPSQMLLETGCYQVGSDGCWPNCMLLERNRMLPGWQRWVNREVGSDGCCAIADAFRNPMLAPGCSVRRMRRGTRRKLKGARNSTGGNAPRSNYLVGSSYFAWRLSWLVLVLKSVASAAFSEKASIFCGCHGMPVKSLANASADLISRLQRHAHENTGAAIKGLISELAPFFRFRLH